METFPCDICDIKITAKEWREHRLSVLHHLRIDSLDKTAQHSCPLCRVTFKTLREYTEHGQTEMHNRKRNRFREGKENLNDFGLDAENALASRIKEKKSKNEPPKDHQEKRSDDNKGTEHDRNSSPTIGESTNFRNNSSNFSHYRNFWPVNHHPPAFHSDMYGNRQQDGFYQDFGPSRFNNPNHFGSNDRLYTDFSGGSIVQVPPNYQNNNWFGPPNWEVPYRNTNGFGQLPPRPPGGVPGLTFPYQGPPVRFNPPRFNPPSLDQNDNPNKRFKRWESINPNLNLPQNTNLSQNPGPESEPVANTAMNSFPKGSKFPFIKRSNKIMINEKDICYLPPEKRVRKAFDKKQDKTLAQKLEHVVEKLKASEKPKCPGDQRKVKPKKNKKDKNGKGTIEINPKNAGVKKKKHKSKRNKDTSNPSSKIEDTLPKNQDITDPSSSKTTVQSVSSIENRLQNVDSMSSFIDVLNTFDVSRLIKPKTTRDCRLLENVMAQYKKLRPRFSGIYNKPFNSAEKTKKLPRVINVEEAAVEKLLKHMTPSPQLPPKQVWSEICGYLEDELAKDNRPNDLELARTSAESSSSDLVKEEAEQVPNESTTIQEINLDESIVSETPELVQNEEINRVETSVQNSEETAAAEVLPRVKTEPEESCQEETHPDFLEEMINMISAEENIFYQLRCTDVEINTLVYKRAQLMQSLFDIHKRKRQLVAPYHTSPSETETQENSNSLEDQRSTDSQLLSSEGTPNTETAPNSTSQQNLRYQYLGSVSCSKEVLRTLYQDIQHVNEEGGLTMRHLEDFGRRTSQESDDSNRPTDDQHPINEPEFITCDERIKEEIEDEDYTIEMET